MGAILLLLLIVWTHAQESALAHFAVLAVQDSAASHELQTRFKATGTPVFLVRQPRNGVSVGDILRFKDKAILVDANIMQTLQSSGALRGLRQAPVLRVQAKSQSHIWEARAGMVQNAQEIKAYRLGAEVLKIFEDYFGKVPQRESIILNFSGGVLELLVPEQLMDPLNFARVRKITPGKPMLISPVPDTLGFVGDSLNWTAWGADPSSPESALRYGVEGELPPGIVWNVEKHRLEGRLGATGTWSLIAWVRNEQGLADSLKFRLSARENSAPRFLFHRGPDIQDAESWSWLLPVADEDHARGVLRCGIGELPNFLILDTAQCQVSGRVPSSVQQITMKLWVRDPLNRSDTAVLQAFRVLRPPNALRLIRRILPLDSLREGQAVEWLLRDVLASGVRLETVQGPDSVSVWQNEAGEHVLRLRPMRAGMDTLSFLLSAQEDTALVRQVIYVRPNRGPRFVSALSAYRVWEGTTLRYKPVAVDPDGDSLRLLAVDADGSVVQMNQRGEVDLWTASPGRYAMEFVADDGARLARQQIAWIVEPGRREWLGVQGRMAQVGEAAHYWLSWRRGGGRFGLFSPRLGEVIQPKSSAFQEWPFIFAGGSLLGERGLARGEWLYLDVGLLLRNPQNRLITGGFMFNIEGHWKSRDRRNPWVFEIEIGAHVNQAIVVVDTSEYSEQIIQVTVDPEQWIEGDSSYLKMDSIFQAILGKSYFKLMRDIGSRENVVLASRLEFLVPVMNLGEYGDVWLGPVAFREDYMVGVDLNQWMGVSLRHQIEWKFLSLTHTWRVGIWGSQNQNYRMRYDLSLSFGYWR